VMSNRYWWVIDMNVYYLYYCIMNRRSIGVWDGVSIGYKYSVSVWILGKRLLEFGNADLSFQFLDGR